MLSESECRDPFGKEDFILASDQLRRAPVRLEFGRFRPPAAERESLY